MIDALWRGRDLSIGGPAFPFPKVARCHLGITSTLTSTSTKTLHSTKEKKYTLLNRLA